MAPSHPEEQSPPAEWGAESREQTLRRHLDGTPDDVEGWVELSGLLCRRQALHEAVPPLEQALRLDPAHRVALSRLGGVLQHLGQLERSRDMLSRAVASHPDHVEAWCNLGIVNLRLETIASLHEAVQALERSLELQPDQPLALRALIRTLRLQQQPQRALQPLSRLVELEPQHWPELLSLAHELGRLGHASEERIAEQLAEAASRRAPEPLQRWGDPPWAAVKDASLARSLQQRGNCEEALETGDRAVRLAPDLPAGHCARAFALQALGRAEEGLAAIRQALALQPEEREFLNLQAVCLMDLGRHEEAIAVLDRGLAPGEVPEMRHNRALCRLRHSDLREGWDDYEARLKLPVTQLMHQPEGPIWRGEDLGGAPLLLVGEQGNGDVMQFLRYLPLLRQRCGTVILCLPASLSALVRAADLTDAVWTPNQASGHQGPWLPMLSVFHVLQAAPHQLPTASPYLKVPDGRVEHWRQRLRETGEPLVALHWQGNPTFETGSMRGRSLPLEALAPVSRCTSLRLVSLQKGHGSEQLGHCSFRDRFTARQHLVETALDFLESAAVLKACDLLITSDSGLAHLAGGLGIPVWLLLHHRPDWRWGRAENTTPWYPTMRLFRQERPGDWGSVIEQVCRELPEALPAFSDGGR
ncbi:MAG: tetratricopeptide repeat protein [Cyanobium sp.]